jgi:hypothetical protein
MIKKLLVILLAAAMLLCIPVGCQNAPKSIDGEALYQQMNALGLFPDMAHRSPDMVYDYYGIDPAQCKQLVNYASADGLIADEFLLAETNDEAYAEETEALLREQIAHQAETYRDYLPQEYPKLANARIERNGCYVLVIIADDTAPLYKIYTDSLK